MINSKDNAMMQITNESLSNNEMLNSIIEQQIETINQLNEKLLISEQLKSNFISNIRNEINNPITSTLELTRYLSGILTDPELKKIASMILNEISNLEFQMRNIIVSAELEAGEVVVKPVKTDLIGVLTNVIRSQKHLIDKKALKLNINTYIERDFITDPELLQHIITNLVLNAVRFSGGEESITIDAIIAENEFTFNIVNTGVTITDESKKLLFHRFRQIEEGMQKGFNGHGLGLSIVKALCEFLNGEIVLDNSESNSVRFILKITEMQAEDNGLMFSDNGNDFLFTDNV